MSSKRKREGEDGSSGQGKRSKKVDGGFKVGPDNLPDGIYKRKTQKIKSDLIERARIKKDYAKLKRQGKVQEEREELPQPASMTVAGDSPEPSNTPHPARQALIEGQVAPPDASRGEQPRRERWQRKQKAAPFKKETEQAQRRRAEAEERRKAREEAERQRREKIEERERFRRAMAKARTGGPNGQRKLGRESTVLLEKVKRMVGDGGG